MKRIILIIVVALLLAATATLIVIDYHEKKKKFYLLQQEYNKSLDWQDLLVGKINNYFFKNGWFPDSLQQVDTIFTHEASKFDLTETEYQYFIDPFTKDFYFYLPVLNEKYGRTEGYYLLSAGVDSKIDNVNLKGLGLYDSLRFNYLDFYFGRKDLLVDKRSIKDWVLESQSYDVSLKELLESYDPDQRRDPSLYRQVTFYGIVDSVYLDHFVVKDVKSDLQGRVYLAPFSEKANVSIGDRIQIKGIYNRIEFKPDTVMTFLNSMIVE